MHFGGDLFNFRRALSLECTVVGLGEFPVLSAFMQAWIYLILEGTWGFQDFEDPSRFEIQCFYVSKVACKELE